jgi:hypothetical protein
MSSAATIWKKEPICVVVGRSVLAVPAMKMANASAPSIRPESKKVVVSIPRRDRERDGESDLLPPIAAFKGMTFAKNERFDPQTPADGWRDENQGL